MEKAKILICDDEKGTRESLKFILQGKYELSFANDGPQALEYIKNHPTDLILLDIKMPGMDGIKVLKKLKKMLKVKVIVITGYSTVSIAHRAIKHGAREYIPKPFDKAYILAAIEKTLKAK
jgi:DNA-binding NtrC family response regulator